ncbi:BadF/BadG/BcrA/BcrD ATPase family protein [Acidithiobacillus thiooxidans]|uniref:N-acetylmuramic acid/N-acetylglucosamine kinase n=1 Tax=Acidithiobacillus thiooxidans ATCC 19377 TaxID=637390 RepID=A0A543PZZ3_ACITH|nr:BadF/BadG/BcrA/BcrD ATPase family protein [Acidithiobacillus thiooxidans]MDX5936354.1 BadF/BadG/BcrA/BcrD ATPase family protein [Acidithiobacillus thiooxidans]TQN49642.1 N-acetylmuramic acid/N-acetylglucosamine kinase [Acidithiobacillus thiooxidans ATCC 19377]
MKNIEPLDGLHLGIDGGGTSTTGVLVDKNGKILCKKEAGPSNPNFVGLDSSIKEINKIINYIKSEYKNILNYNIGLAGYSSFPQRERLKNAIIKDNKFGDYILQNDVDILLYNSTEESPVVALVCGTGSVAMTTIKNTKKILRVGGWGYLFGDEGSGYSIGRECLKAITRAADGRGKSTILSQLVFEALKITTAGGLVPSIYNSPNPKKTISDLSCIVDKAAVSEDEIAIDILKKAADELIEMSKYFVDYFFPVTPNFRISGSVITQSKIYYKHYKKAMNVFGISEEHIEVIKYPAHFNAMITVKNQNLTN